MIWNWQQEDWPHFHYDAVLLRELEDNFLKKSGMFLGAYQHMTENDQCSFMIEAMSDEAVKTSEIEGEYLNRESLQSSLRKNFGLDTDACNIPPAEQGISEMMVDLYQTCSASLTHETLFGWHVMLTKGRCDLKDVGRYRTHKEPMQVVSGYVHAPKVHFEAPPSKDVWQEMEAFIGWFNKTAPGEESRLPALTRAGMAHLYFVCIHPFEDGNGRIGRAIAQKALSQGLKQPALIALSHTIQNNKKAYYDKLESHNKDMEITPWLRYFAETILKAQDYTQNMITFLIEKAKLYDKLRGQLNLRQQKVIARLFREGPGGFKGGLSAENYISMTGTSRATATRDLQNLVDIGALTPTGILKSTRYYLNIRL